MTAVNKLIALALLFWLPVAWAQKVDFAIDQVAIDTNSCGSAAAKQLLFACHRLGRGQGFAVAERRYWAPKKTDDDAFEKLTVYFVSKPKPGYVVDLPSDAVAVIFSSGPSSFPGKHGCYGQAGAGKIQVTDVSEKTVTIKVDASIDLKSPLGWQGECKQAHLQKEVAAHMIGFEELNAWYGRVGPSYDLWKESHP